MRRISAKLALTAACLASALPIPAHAAEERQVLVTVLAPEGGRIAELAPRDLVVREDGVAREVLRVQRATAPLTIAVLVDTSTAADRIIADIRRGLTAFIGALDPAHEVALVTFGDRSTLVVDYTTDRERLREAATRLYPRTESGAYLLDALMDAARGLERREAERPVIVALATEGIEFSNRTYTEVLPRLAESRAALYALVLSTGTRADPAQDEVRHRDMVIAEGTRASGGRREQLLTAMSLPTVMAELAAELQDQWVVTYSRPDALVPPERLQVDAAREGLTVRAPTQLPEKRTP